MNNTVKHNNIKNISGAKALMFSLINEGVEIIFGYTGGAIMPVYDALYDFKDELKHYMCRHEQGVIHSAQGYARISQKAGVCFATSGPGATNLVTGIADAFIDSTPLVCISGQVASSLLGSDAFQEVDIISISMPITKWNFQITKAKEIPEIIAKAFYIANTGRPGPVLIDITKDAQIEILEQFTYKKTPTIFSYEPEPSLDNTTIDQAAKLIDNAKKPFILVGQGVKIAKAEDELLQFINKSGIPFAATLLGLATLSSEHPLFQGMLGMHGGYAANLNTNKSDLIIAIGMRFDDRVTGKLAAYAKQAKIIHIELDAAEINKNVKCDVAINANAKTALKELTTKIKSEEYPQWLEKFVQLQQIENKKVVEKQLDPKGSKIKMIEVIKMLSSKSRKKTIIVTDVGQHQMIAAQYFKFGEDCHWITSGGLGTMGFGLPAAIGAKIAAPDKQVVLVVGDGGFQMTMQELMTIKQFNLSVKILILNNKFLGMVRQWQDLFFEKRYSETELENPDFITLSKSFGIDALKIEKRKEMNDALDKFLKSPEAFLLEVEVEQEDNVFPMVPSGSSVSDTMLE